MKDIEYGLFAQITYYNWFNYNVNEKNLFETFKSKPYMKLLLDGKLKDFQDQNKEFEIELSNGKTAKIYNEQDKRLLMMYSEDKERADINQKYKSLFEGWELIEGTNHEKIYNECPRLPIRKNTFVGSEPSGNTYGVKMNYEDRGIEFNCAGISQPDSGFQAVAFKKGNKIIISLRGTDFGSAIDGLDDDKEFNKDMVDTNLEIYSDIITDQVLCSIYFYEKIKNEYPTSEIHVTGHSLGGGLAQFVALYGGEDIKKTVTWNGLGVRNVYEELTSASSVGRRLLQEVASFAAETYNDVTSGSFGTASKSLLETSIKLPRLGYTCLYELIDIFCDMSKEKKNYSRKLDYEKAMLELIEEHNLNNYEKYTQNPFNSLMKIKIVNNVNKNYNKLSRRLINFYLDGDIVRALSSKTGTNVCVDNPENSTYLGGVVKLGETVFRGGNLSWHGINNFLPFFKNDGTINNDTLSQSYIQNFMKTLIIKNLKSDIQTNGRVKDSGYGIEITRETKEKVVTEILLNKNRALLNKLIFRDQDKFLMLDEIEEELNKGISPYRIEEDEVVLGTFANYELLGGVRGLEEIRFNLLDILKNQHPDGRKIDYICEILLEKEFKKNGLNFMVKEGQYNLFSSVVETMHTKDLTIFDLASKALNQSADLRIYLEKAIEDAIPQGELKANYEAKEKWTPSDTDKIKKLFDQASKTSRPFGTPQVNTPKSKKFYKSFLDKLQEEDDNKKRSEKEKDKRIAKATKDNNSTSNSETRKISLRSIKYSDKGAWGRIKDDYKNC